MAAGAGADEDGTPVAGGAFGGGWWFGGVVDFVVGEGDFAGGDEAFGDGAEMDGLVGAVDWREGEDVGDDGADVCVAEGDVVLAGHEEETAAVLADAVAEGAGPVGWGEVGGAGAVAFGEVSGVPLAHGAVVHDEVAAEVRAVAFLAAHEVVDEVAAAVDGGGVVFGDG